MTPREKAWLVGVAERRGLSVARMLVEAVADSEINDAEARAVSRAVAQALGPELGPLRAQLGNIGGNVNQIARVLNRGGEVNDDTVARVLGRVMASLDVLDEAMMGKVEIELKR